MEKNISILGCGWIGMTLAKQLSEKGNNVKGSTTSDGKFDELKSAGVAPHIVDIRKGEQDFSSFLSSEVLIIAITSKSINDFKGLITQIETSSIQKILFISSTSVYPENNETVTEETPLKDTLLAQIEHLFTSNKSFSTTILRFGGLFGYNRKPGNFFKDGRMIEKPEAPINFIHRDDCIHIIEKIMELDVWDEVFNAVTDTHPCKRDFYTKEFKNAGREAPSFNEESPNEFKIVSNVKLKRMLGYQFKYPDMMTYEE